MADGNVMICDDAAMTGRHRFECFQSQSLRTHGSTQRRKYRLQMDRPAPKIAPIRKAHVLPTHKYRRPLFKKRRHAFPIIFSPPSAPLLRQLQIQLCRQRILQPSKNHLARG